MTTPTQEVTNTIKALPGVTTRELYELLPHLKQTVVSYAVHRLKMTGAIVEGEKKELPVKGVRGKTRLFSTYLVNDNPTPPVKRRKLKSPTEAGLKAQLEEARAKIAELEAWKQGALARHPDLGVPPVVLKARAIVAAELRAAHDHNLADLVMSGKKDETLLVKVTIKGLEEGDE
jgi:hypothetical protein